MFVRAALNALSPAHANARLSVFIFHRVLPAPDELQPEEMHAQRFDLICGWLKDWFNVIPLDLAVNQLRYGTLPSRACAITFDDGYADNLHIATPILKKHSLCATFFIATGFLNGGCMWNDTVIEAIRGTSLDVLDVPGLGEYSMLNIKARSDAIHTIIQKIKYLSVDERHLVTEKIVKCSGADPTSNLMMVSDDLRRLREHGMQIGAHTINHPILARLPVDEARREMKEGQSWLQDMLRERVGLFAYPNGKPTEDYLPEHVDIARELGFDAAVTTTWGAASALTDIFQLPRFTPWDQTKFRFGVRSVMNLRSR